MSRSRSLSGLFACALSCALGCAPPAEPEASSWVRPDVPQPRLVLLYAPCTVNASFLSPYSPDVAYTPSLQAFADAGTVFESHRTEAGLSGIAYASLLSGVQAPDHHVFTHPKRLSDDLYLIPEAFRDAGYETFAWTAHSMASPDLNYTQGVPEENTFSRLLGPGHARFNQLLQRLAAGPDHRAFVFSNFTVTHGPYSTNTLDRLCGLFPEECDLLDEFSDDERAAYLRAYRESYAPLRYNFPWARARLAERGLDPNRLAELLELLYRANIHYLDELFGGVLRKIEEAGLADDTLIIFTADHGETLYDPRAPFQWSHGHSLQGDVLTVPFLVRGPGITAGRIARTTRSIDVHPTILGLAGISPVEATVGQNLAPMLMGGPEPPPVLAFSHTGKLPTANLQMAHDDIALLKSFYPDNGMEHTWAAARRGERTWKLVPRNHGWGIESLAVRGVGAELATGFERMPRAARKWLGQDWFDSEERRRHAEKRSLVAYREELIAAAESLGPERPNSESLTDEERIERLKSLGYVH